jgi:cytochrome d ubiquinol oxidase subunit II
MLTPELLVAGVMLVALIVYTLTGGADFGGGVWDLLARGPRAREQRELIAEAIGPIWEANHVWMILVVVLMFVAFPTAFSTVSIALHIPLTLMLIGIVLRGTSFVFRTYDVQSEAVHKRWSLVFSISSLVTPVFLGINIGAIVSGGIRVHPANGIVKTGFIKPWLQPFPFVLGFFTLSLFAFLAAVYLVLETSDKELQEDFRRKALLSGFTTGLLAWGCFFLSKSGAPIVHKGLSGVWWSIPFQALTAMVSLVTLGLLWKRSYRVARWAAMVQVSLILVGWGLAQFPFVVVPDLTFANTAAPRPLLRSILWALLAGSFLLVPSFFYLYRLFKKEQL